MARLFSNRGGEERNRSVTSRWNGLQLPDMQPQHHVPIPFFLHLNPDETAPGALPLLHSSGSGGCRIVALCDACKTVGFISGDQYGNILRVEAGFFTDFFVLLPFGSHLKCCQSFFNIFVSILFPRSLDFLRFLKRKSVSFHFSSLCPLYNKSDILSNFFKRC